MSHDRREHLPESEHARSRCPALPAGLVAGHLRLELADYWLDANQNSKAIEILSPLVGSPSLLSRTAQLKLAEISFHKGDVEAAKSSVLKLLETAEEKLEFYFKKMWKPLVVIAVGVLGFVVAAVLWSNWG